MNEIIVHIVLLLYLFFNLFKNIKGHWPIGTKIKNLFSKIFLFSYIFFFFCFSFIHRFFLVHSFSFAMHFRSTCYVHNINSTVAVLYVGNRLNHSHCFIYWTNIKSNKNLCIHSVNRIENVAYEIVMHVNK